MKHTAIFVAGLLLAGAAGADPFPNADPNAGKKYFDEAKCNACHASIVGGDANQIFTRSERRIRDAQQLLKMVRFCVDRTGAGVLPEDIEHIAAYLNREFYKFK